ncbi:MAG: hypothetical protein ACK47B_14940 [Armatimonadota bacterium]
MLLTLRVVLVFDAAILFLLGLALLFVPVRVGAAFGFTEVPAGFQFLVSLWGCALFSLGLGYVAAARDPHRHVVWVQVGIVRGVLEALVGILYLARGLVSTEQALGGTILAAVMAVAYMVLYPRTLTGADAAYAAAEGETDGR